MQSNSKLAINVERLSYLGTASTLMLALLVARHRVAGSVAWVNRHWAQPPKSDDILPAYLSTEPHSDFRAWVLVLSFVGVCGLVHAGLGRLLQTRPRARGALDAVLLLAALILAAKRSLFCFGSTVVLVLVTAMIFRTPAREADVVETKELTSTTTTCARATIVAQGVALAWGVWLTTFTKEAGTILALLLATAGITLIRARRRGRALHEEAWAGVAFVLLPLAGLRREPSIKYIVAAATGYLIVRVIARRTKPPSLTIPLLASVCSMLTIFVLPYQFRELAHLNHYGHESGQFAWTNSILHGKAMMADAGTLYGPLRQYLIALYVVLAGVTAENVRIAQILANVVCLGLLVLLGWKACAHRWGFLWWYALLLLTATFTACWLDYRNEMSFGWADLGRNVVPLSCVVGLSSALGREQPSARSIVAWGIGAGLGLLYAQEFGAVAIAAGGATLVVHTLATRHDRRVRRLLLLGTSYTFGVLVSVGSFVLVYVALGRGRLLLRTFWTSVTLFGSGRYAALASPLSPTVFDSWEDFAVGSPAPPLEYAITLFVYLVAMVHLTRRLVMRRWDARSTFYAALTIYGALSAKVLLGRADRLHLLSATIPAVLLVVGLVVDVYAAFDRRKHPIGFTLARIAAFAIVLGSFSLSGFRNELCARTMSMVRGEQTPSKGPRYRYANIPRAGDVLIPPETVQLVEYILHNSNPTDTIFNGRDFTSSAEIFFLANRANVTRFDLPCEMATTALREEAMELVKSRPPAIVFGYDNWAWRTEDRDFLKNGWNFDVTFGGIPVGKRKVQLQSMR